MFGLPPKATISLPFLSGPDRADLARAALLAPAEDAVVERPVGRPEDLDQPEPAVGLGVEDRGEVVVDRDQRLLRLAVLAVWSGITLGNIGSEAQP